MQYAHALGLKEGLVLTHVGRCSTGAAVGGFLFFFLVIGSRSLKRATPLFHAVTGFRVCCFRFRFPIRMPKGMGRCQASLLKSFRPGEVQSQSCEWHILLSKTGGMILQYRSIYR